MTPSPRIIKLDGVQHSFPSDATDDEIRTALGGGPTKPASGPQRTASGSIPGASNEDTPENRAFQSGLHQRHDTRGLDEMTGGLTIPALYSAPGATLASMGLGYGAHGAAKALGASEPVADVAGLAAGGFGGKMMPGLSKGLPQSVSKFMDIFPGSVGSKIDRFLRPAETAVPTAPIPPVRFNAQPAAPSYQPPPLKFNSAPAGPEPVAPPPLAFPQRPVVAPLTPPPPVRFNQAPTETPQPIVAPPPVKYLPKASGPVKAPPPPTPIAPRPEPVPALARNPEAMKNAEALRDSMGTPAAAKPDNSNFYAGGSHETRLDNVGKIADAIGNAPESEWIDRAKQLDIKWPTTKQAQSNLVRDLKAEMLKRRNSK